MMRLIREAGYDAPIYIHGALEKLTEFYQANGIALGDVRKVVTKSARSWRRHRACARRARSRISGPADFPIPSRPSPPAGCGCAPAPASAAWNCRSSSPTIPTGTISAAPSSRPAQARSGSRTAQEDALVHWCVTQGIRAKPLHIVGYGDEGEVEPGEPGAAPSLPRRRSGALGVNRFAALLDRLAYEPGRNAKLRLMTDYFRTTPDPERGFALAAMAGGLTFANAKPGLIRALIMERTDPVLFGLSYDYRRRPLRNRRAALARPRAAAPNDGHAAARPRRGGARRCRRATAPTCRACSRAGSTRWTRPAAGRC